MVGDVSDEAFVKQAFQTAARELGKTDILVNNAGVSHIGLLTDMSLSEWNRVLQVNLTSLFCCCKYAES